MLSHKKGPTPNVTFVTMHKRRVFLTHYGMYDDSRCFGCACLTKQLSEGEMHDNLNEK